MITGKGSYTGEIVKNFTIKKAELGAGGAIGDIKTFTYTGKAICPSVTVTYGKTRLTAKDYRVYYTRNTEAGTARVTVTGTGNYTGTLAGEFTIAAKEIRKCSIRVSDAPLLTATGGIPEITVKDGGTVLLQGRDYTVSYQDNHSLGKATAIITGCGSYGGETVKTYQVKKDFTAAKLAWDLPDDYYNGKETEDFGDPGRGALKGRKGLYLKLCKMQKCECVRIGTGDCKRKGRVCGKSVDKLYHPTAVPEFRFRHGKQDPGCGIQRKKPGAVLYREVRKDGVKEGCGLYSFLLPERGRGSGIRDNPRQGEL